MDLFFWCPGLICKVSWSNLQGNVEFSHRGAHRGRHGSAERTSCAERADNERTTIARAVRCCSVRGSVCGLSFGGVGSVLFGALFGWRLLPRWLQFGSVRCAVRLAVTSSVVAVRFGSVRCSVGGGSLGWLGSAGGCSLGWLGSAGGCSLGWLGSACGCYLGVCPPCRCGRPAAHTLLLPLWVGECLVGWYEHGGGDDTRGTTGHQTPAWAAWPYRPKGRRVEAR